MRIVVLLAGGVDPKWPVQAGQLASSFAGVTRKLTPFDESALECALKLRDANPATQIRAIVATPAAGEVLARSVAAFRADIVAIAVVEQAIAWDATLLGGALAERVSGEAPDAVFLGREFGDVDDGVVAPALAEALGWRYVGLAQEIVEQAGALEFLRDRGDREERIRVDGPVVASITNDRRNRLRYPLLKNVALAKRDKFSSGNLSAGHLPRITLRNASDRVADKTAAPCRLVSGSIDEQATELARFLHDKAAR